MPTVHVAPKNAPKPKPKLHRKAKSMKLSRSMRECINVSGEHLILHAADVQFQAVKLHRQRLLLIDPAHVGSSLGNAVRAHSDRALEQLEKSLAALQAYLAKLPYRKLR